jgi:hypothetical protein
MLQVADFENGGTVNRKELEQRIWGKSIESARKAGIISEQEAQFLLNEYLNDFQVKNGWDGKAYIAPRSF